MKHDAGSDAAYDLNGKFNFWKCSRYLFWRNEQEAVATAKEEAYHYLQEIKLW